jgi:alkanesulfonate monooxygenase SsuD/methylene tetrahydromethanopterin reductase-like flavin-dependent oxidoreductase (luciferase family)
VCDEPRRVEWIQGRLLEMWRNYCVQWVDNPPPHAGQRIAGDFDAKLAQREAMAEQISKRFVVGSPAQVIEGLGPLIDAGADGFAFRVRFDGVGGAELRRCLELLASEVLPQLRRMSDAP